MPYSQRWTDIVLRSQRRLNSRPGERRLFQDCVPSRLERCRRVRFTVGLWTVRVTSNSSLHIMAARAVTRRASHQSVARSSRLVRVLHSQTLALHWCEHSRLALRFMSTVEITPNKNGCTEPCDSASVPCQTFLVPGR